MDVKHKWRNSTTLWKVSRLNTVLGLNKENESLNLRIPSEYRKTRTRNNSVFGHFHAVYFLFILYLCYRFYSTIRSLSRALLLKKSQQSSWWVKFGWVKFNRHEKTLKPDELLMQLYNSVIKKKERFRIINEPKLPRQWSEWNYLNIQAFDEGNYGKFYQYVTAIE